jgi:hypothetical protein
MDAWLLHLIHVIVTARGGFPVVRRIPVGAHWPSPRPCVPSGGSCPL